MNMLLQTEKKNYESGGKKNASKASNKRRKTVCWRWNGNLPLLPFTASMSPQPEKQHRAEQMQQQPWINA